MFVYPYDTTVCSGYVTILGNLRKSIATAQVAEGLTTTIDDIHGKPATKNNSNIYFVTGKNKEIQPFTHPILVEFSNYSGLVVDARSFTKSEKVGNVYSRWIAEGIAKRHGLNPSDQLRFGIIAAFFYISLFKEDPTFTSEELNKNSQLISKALYAPIDMCFEIADQLLPMRSVKDLCAMATSILTTSRLEKFNAGLLFNDLMSSWYGSGNAREVVAVALEHPPTWIAMLNSALNERTYRNSTISKVAIANDKNGAGKVFTMNVRNLID